MQEIQKKKTKQKKNSMKARTVNDDFQDHPKSQKYKTK